MSEAQEIIYGRIMRMCEQLDRIEKKVDGLMDHVKGMDRSLLDMGYTLSDEMQDLHEGMKRLLPADTRRTCGMCHIDFHGRAFRSVTGTCTNCYHENGDYYLG